MGDTIIFATGNEGKMKEIRLILKDLPMNVISMKEAGIMLQIIEDGTTFAQNAAIKAMAIWKETGGIVLADDSGLEVDFLNGQPGVYSARYMGESTDYRIKNQSIIQRLSSAKQEQRTARFVCVIAAVTPDGQVLYAEGAMEGVIAKEPSGEGGFGYDPILYLPEYEMTCSQLSIEQKNQISHRAKALEQMKVKLQTWLLEVDK